MSLTSSTLEGWSNKEKIKPPECFSVSAYNRHRARVGGLAGQRDNSPEQECTRHGNTRKCGKPHLEGDYSPSFFLTFERICDIIFIDKKEKGRYK